MSSNDETKVILNKIASIGILRPTTNVSIVLKYLGFEGIDESLLNDLVNKGFLKRSFIDKLLACPRCGSLSIITKYTCPRCGSINLEKTKIIQHVECGYTDSIIKFLRPDNTLICPKCSREVNDKNMKVYIQFFECLSCGFKTSQPNIIHICGNCGNIFKPIDATFKPVYIYELSDKGKELIRK